MLEFKEICKFNLKNISFNVEKGKWFTIKGHGGAGKTTILKLAYGLLKQDNGIILLFGKKLNKIPSRKKISFIPQEGGLFDSRTVLSNLVTPLKLIGKYNEDILWSTIERTGLMEYTKTKASALPASRRQLLKIALALVKRPVMILADEPTEHLDNEMEKKVRSLFQELNIIGTTIVWTTSKEIPEQSTKVLHIKDGTVLLEK